MMSDTTNRVDIRTAKDTPGEIEDAQGRTAWEIDGAAPLPAASATIDGQWVEAHIEFRRTRTGFEWRWLAVDSDAAPVRHISIDATGTGGSEVFPSMDRAVADAVETLRDLADA